MKKTSLIAALLAAVLITPASAAEAPRLVQRDGQHALLVEGKPFLTPRPSSALGQEHPFDPSSSGHSARPDRSE